VSRVAVLRGGRSLERAVSMNSGAQVAQALEQLGHEVLAIDPGSGLVEELLARQVDCAFVALHGREGEDGTLQAALEAAGIPYTGSGPAACALCSDKDLAKRLLAAAGLPTPPARTLAERAIREFGAAAALGRVAEDVGPDLIVKPVHGGSAIGVKRVDSAQELPAALAGTFAYDDRVLIERRISGRELAVAVLGDGERAQALPVVEILPRGAGDYDYDARYAIGGASFRCPADLDAGLAAELAQIALEAHALLGCRALSRVDMLLDEPGRPWVLEVDAVPGMTETSLLPQAAAAAGIEWPEVVRRVLEAALA
jgi:D-alanine-D-alanine ligase